MDFLTLSRRELQTLCKKNKIPANITNAAMIDALKALDIVEGIEEILKPSESETAQSSIESPERTEITSSGVPRTGGRTSTRRKPMKEEPESSQICPRTTRRSTRRALASEVEEPKVVVPETPAVAPGTRKRVPVASAHRKVETQLKEGKGDGKNGCQMVSEKKGLLETPVAAANGRRQGNVASARRKIEMSSVRRVYSTRRSVRMSEKKVEESEEEEKERKEAVSEISGMSGLDMQKASEEAFEETNDSEFGSVQKYALSKSESGFDDTQESTCESYQVDDSNAIHEDISEAFDKMVVVSVPAEHPNNLMTERDRDLEDGGHDESKGSKSEAGSKIGDNLQATLLDEAVDMEDEVLENKGADDVRTDNFQSVVEDHSELLRDGEEKMNSAKDMECEDSATMVFDDNVSKGEAFGVDDAETDPELSTGKVFRDHSYVSEHLVNSKQLESGKEPETTLQVEAPMLELAPIVNAEEHLLPQMEAVADVHDEATAEEVPAITTTHENQNCYSHPSISEEFVSQGSMNFGDLIMAYSHTEDPTPPDAAQESNEQISSPVPVPVPDVDPQAFGATGSNLDHISCLASSLTPGKKSSSSNTPTRSGMMMTHVLADNKENVDNSGRKSEVVTREKFKNKNTSAEDKPLKSLTEKSLRKLTKMLREKLQISNAVDNYEASDTKTSMASRPRTALQTLPENRIHIGGEPEREN